MDSLKSKYSSRSLAGGAFYSSANMKEGIKELIYTSFTSGGQPKLHLPISTSSESLFRKTEYVHTHLLSKRIDLEIKTLNFYQEG
jgi:hypothetical protein